jgi:integrase
VLTQAPRLADYLDYWLEEVIRPTRRPSTYKGYEHIIRLNLKPGLGAYHVHKLTPQIMQAFFNRQLAAGTSVRRVQMMREVLSSALTQAMREDLVMRNVARLAKLPTAERTEIQPWTVAEALRFLEASRNDPLYAAFTLLTCYGLRKGEVIGIRWQDVDFQNGLIRIRQQVQYLNGKFYTGPVKTRAGKRDLPLLGMVRVALAERRRVQVEQQRVGGELWQYGDAATGLVFTTTSGLPIDPNNFSRSFHRICDQHSIRRIRVHDVRHTAATLLMNLKVPARQAQLILGHANISTTQQIYQHGDMENRRIAMQQVEEALSRSVRTRGNVDFLDQFLSAFRKDNASGRCGQELLSTSPLLQQNDKLHLEPMEGFEPTTLCLQITLETSTRERVTDMAGALYISWRCWLVGLVVVKTVVKS